MTYLELARRQRGWSQKKLGDHPRIRIWQTFISMIERGAALPVPDQVARLSEVLGVPPDLLMTHVPEGTPVPDFADEEKDATLETSESA